MNHSRRDIGFGRKDRSSPSRITVRHSPRLGGRALALEVVAIPGGFKKTGRAFSPARSILRRRVRSWSFCFGTFSLDTLSAILAFVQFSKREDGPCA